MAANEETPRSDELTKKVTDWIGKQGYPLEMEVALAFQRAGFYVRLSEFYRDFETDQLREIDVSAVKHSSFDHSWVMQVCYRVECKLARDKPWVLFVSQVQPDIPTPASIVGCRTAVRLLWNMYHSLDVYQEVAKLPMFDIGHIAYGLTQALTTGADVPYQAVMSSLKAAVDRARQFERNPPLSKVRLLGIAFPVIVIDGRLFECYIDGNMQVVTQEVEKGVLSWQSPTPVSMWPLIHVCTKAALDQLVHDADKTATGIIRLIEDLPPDKAAELAGILPNP